MTSPRPRSLVVVLGTATEIGKTWVSVELLRHLRATGLQVAARKPAQSFTTDELGATDAEQLAAATGEAPTTVCSEHRWYATPMAPPMAADALGRPPIALADLAGEITWAADTTPDVGLVETAGGPCSPIAHDGDGIDLAVVLAADQLVLVADAGLGTISAVRLTTTALEARGVGTPLTVHLNRFDADDDLHRRNLAWLAGGGCAATTTVDELSARLTAS